MIALLRPKHGRPQNFMLATYTFLLFALGTVFMAMNIHLAQLGFIDDRNFPGGPEAYEEFRYDSALAVIPNAAFILSNWLADGLLASILLWCCLELMFRSSFAAKLSGSTTPGS